MNVSSIANTPLPPAPTSFTKSKRDLQSLLAALNSGDLAGAQKDFADFQSDMASLGITPAATPKGIQQASADFKALQTDLNSGDLAAAQKDFSTLLQDLQGVSGQHKHHHQEYNNSEPAGPTASGTAGNGFNFRAVLAAYNDFTNTGATGTSLNATA